QATVSFVLNRAPGVKISEETRARVIRAAISLGYAPPTLAHLTPEAAAPADGSGPVGFLVDQLATSPEAVVAIDGARAAAWEDGRVVLAAQTLNDVELERKTLKMFQAHQLAGLIYM